MPSACNESKYKTYRNNLNHILKKAKKQHYTDLLAANKNNINKNWQIMKDVVNKNEVKKNYSKFKLNDGSLTENKTVISNKFNEFFINIGPNLAKKIHQLGIDPLNHMGGPDRESIF